MAVVLDVDDADDVDASDHERKKNRLSICGRNEVDIWSFYSSIPYLRRCDDARLVFFTCNWNDKRKTVRHA